MVERIAVSTGTERLQRGAVAQWSIWSWRFARKKPLGGISAIVFLVLVAVAVFANVIAPYSPYERVQQVGTFAGPSGQHLFGTDQYGRDVFSRVVFGSRNTLYVSILAVALSTLIGLVVGLSSGYFRGTYDTIVQRVVDVLQALPTIILALAIVAVRGGSSNDLILAIGIAGSPGVARVMRSSAMAIREMVYIDAAKAAGASSLRVLVRHVLPNAFAPLIISISSHLGGVILIAASLSFLGLGVTEPEPAWGLMLAGSAAAFAKTAPWIPVFPGLAITLTVFSVNLLGDALRDTLDPRLRV